MQKITPFLWFDNNAEEAVAYYVSLFKNAKVTSTSRYGDDEHGVEGSVMSISFQLEGQDFIALNGGPVFQFSQAISFFVNCETQQEVDTLWDKLSEGGEQQQCGWLKDKFGITWQIVPIALGEMLQDKDPEKSRRVMQAMLKMIKLDVNVLKEAYDGE